MGYSSTEAADLASTLESALNSASSGLNKAATELGAEAVAVLHIAGIQVDITYFWSRHGDSSPDPRLAFPLPEHRKVVSITPGLAEAGSPSARFLREAIWPDAQSFWLFPWQIRQKQVTVVFCFSIPSPPESKITEAVKDSLNPIGLATWSVKEVARLHAELRIVNGRLAGRKNVDRAKGILQLERGITEEQAYEFLRSQSRRRRLSIASIAEEILKNRAACEPQAPAA